MYLDGTWLETGGIDVEQIEKRGSHSISINESGVSETRPTVKPRPIFNLITTIRSTWAAASMMEVRQRMGPNSTVIALQDGLGVLEEIFETSFIDPRSRPDFRLATMSHWVFETTETNPGRMKDESQTIFSDTRAKLSGFVLNYKDRGVIHIGPLADGSLSCRKNQQRSQQSHYLLETLKNCRMLDTKMVDYYQSLERRYRKLIEALIWGPLLTIFECVYKDLVSKPGAPELMSKLVLEAWRVVRLDLPGLSYSTFSSWATLTHWKHAYESNVHSMTFYALSGRETDIEKTNGWLVARARLHGLECPTHQLVMDLVIEKTMQARNKLNEEKAAKEKAASEEKKKEEERAEKEREGRPDRVEMKRERKMQRIKMELENQPMPETYTKPKITPLGNVQITKVPEAKLRIRRV